MKTPAIFAICLLLISSCFNDKQTIEEPPEGCGVVIDHGKTQTPPPDVFKAKCASCHSFYKDLTGPKMNGILDRVPSEGWLVQFITNQDSLVQINDSCALEMMKWSNVKWNHNSCDLSQEELDTLIAYITQ